MSDPTEKPKLGARPPLGIKRTVETGKVKQSFSHGRSNTVVVEVKKRRILGKPGEATEAPRTPEPEAEAPKPKPAPKPAPARPARTSPVDDITKRKAGAGPQRQEMHVEDLRKLSRARGDGGSVGHAGARCADHPPLNRPIPAPPDRRPRCARNEWLQILRHCGGRRSALTGC